MAAPIVSIIRKRIDLGGGDTVDIPVLNRVPFVVAAEQYQERVAYFRNDATADRKMHIRRLYDNAGGGSFIDVERIDKLPDKVMQEQAQERIYYLKNTDPPPITSHGENDPRHERVHYVRYYKNNNQSTDIWVDVEMIDRMKITIAAEQYQEWILYLKHALTDNIITDARVPWSPIMVGFCDPSLPLAEQYEGIDPPYRTDPFQNIIGFRKSVEEVPTGDVWRYATLTAACGGASTSGDWVLRDTEGHFEIANGEGYVAGDIDMSHVEQFFEPHTYPDDPTSPTVGVHGFTLDEWDVRPSPGQPWYQPRLDWLAAHPGQVPTPNMFDWADYGHTGFLTGFFNSWCATLAGSGPYIRPYVRVHFTVIESVTDPTTGGPSTIRVGWDGQDNSTA